MVVPVVAAGVARSAAGFARPVVMGGMKKTMQTTARGGAKVGSRSAIRGSAGTGTATRDILNASMVQDSMSLLDSVDQVSKSSSIESSPTKVLTSIKDGITNLGSIFSSKISGLNKHLAFRLDKLNTTMITIGKVLAADLDLEKKTFDEMKDEQEAREKEGSLGNNDKPAIGGKGIFGKLFDGIKGAFGSIVDFLTPSKELVKVGLAGLLVAAVFVFKDQIIKTFETIFTYLGSLKDAFKEGGFKGLGNKIQKDIRENIINPTLASVGIRVKEDGTLGLVQGSFLDIANPFGGPTNIFKTLNAFRTGINPYDNNSKMYPEWYYKGFMENLDDLLTPEDPDMLVNAISGMIDFVSKSVSGFFFGAEKTMPGVGTFREQSGISKMKDQMMENFRNNMQGIADFFHDEDGNLFGIDFKALTDLLPTIQEIAESIYNSLPKYLRFDTIEEKNIDRDVDRLRDTGFFDKDYESGFNLVEDLSHIDRSKIANVSAEELKSLLSKERNDLSKEDVRYIENKIIEKEKLSKVNNTTDNLIKVIVDKTALLKTETLTKVIDKKGELSSGNSKQTISVVADNSQKANVSNYSKTNVNASEFRTDALEMTAFEVHNFYRNRG